MNIEDNYIYQEFKPYLKSCKFKEKLYIEQRIVDQIIWYDNNAIKKTKIL